MELNRVQHTMSAFQMADTKGPEEKSPIVPPKKDTLEDGKDVGAGSQTPSCMSRISAFVTQIWNVLASIVSSLMCFCCCKMDVKKVKAEIEAIIAKVSEEAEFKKLVDALPRQARKELEEIANHFFLLVSQPREDRVDVETLAAAQSEDVAKIKAPDDLNKSIEAMFAGKNTPAAGVIFEHYKDVLEARIPKQQA